MSMIIVHNKTGEDVVARVAGMDYTFRNGVDTPCEMSVAEHVFGFNCDERGKDNALLRLGWIRPGQPKEMALKKLADVIFKKAVVTVTTVGSEDDAENRGGKKAA
jgi:hypothetical protein